MTVTKRSKRMTEALAGVDREQTYGPAEAFDLLKSLPAPKFDESFEVVVRLGVDPRKSDQQVRGAVSLPKGLGKDVFIAVFAEGANAEAAQAAGADVVGSDDLAERIAGGWMDFDIVIASPDMMKHVGKLGRVLGPHGKMPSPKSGTVTPDVAGAVEPEIRHIGQHPALVGNRRRQHHIEGRQPIGGDDQDLVIPDRIHVADLAPGEQFQAFQVGLQQWHKNFLRHKVSFKFQAAKLWRQAVGVESPGPKNCLRDAGRYSTQEVSVP